MDTLDTLFQQKGGVNIKFVFETTTSKTSNSNTIQTSITGKFPSNLVVHSSWPKAPPNCFSGERST